MLYFDAYSINSIPSLHLSIEENCSEREREGVDGRFPNRQLCDSEKRRLDRFRMASFDFRTTKLMPCRDAREQLPFRSGTADYSARTIRRRSTNMVIKQGGCLVTMFVRKESWPSSLTDGERNTAPEA